MVRKTHQSMKSGLFKNRFFLIFETLYLIGIPLALLLYFPELLPFRLVVMAVSLAYIYYVMKVNGISLAGTGISKQNTIESIKYVFIPTFLVSVGLIVLSFYFPMLKNYKEIVAESYGFPTWMIIPFFILISASLQEFVLRGFYIARLELVSKNRAFLLIYSSLIFAVIHSAFQNKLQAPLAFLLGLYLGHVFLKFRSLAGPIFAHAVLGGVFLWLVLK